MKRNMRVLTLVAVCLAMVLLVTVSAVGAGQDEPAAAVMVKTATAAEQAVSMQWTPAMRAAAKPMDMGLTPEQLAAGLAMMDQTPSGGVATYIPGGGPGVGADEAAAAGFPALYGGAAEQAAQLAPAGTAGIYTAFQGNKYAQMWKGFPYKAVGYLTFTMGGGGYRCSASVIGDNVIVTAAHCVYNTDNNTWGNNWSFCPAMKNYACPYGSWGWTNAWIPTAYANAPNWASAIRYDVALVITNTPGGKSVDNIVGYMGRTQDLDYNQLVTTIGYPAGIDGGKFSYICIAETFANGADIEEMGCNSGGGHSGGPWINYYKPFVLGHTNSNMVNNVMSYMYVSGSKAGNTMGAARFSSTNIKVLCDAVPNC
jgi:V8-like Glu-specific endopeptidase